MYGPYYLANVKVEMLKRENHLWVAQYFFSDGGSIKFLAVAETSSDVAVILSEQVDRYRHKDICSVSISREPNKYFQLSGEEDEL
jgi:exoribonuclease R